MTEASYTLLEAVSRDVSMFRDDPDLDNHSIFADIDDDYDLPSDRALAASSGPSYAPANWLDAFNADERSHPGKMGPRSAAPSDDAGLYQMYMTSND